ncbi:MAG: NADH-quinone oxidoreductase subunit D [Ardenticatenaceae bacterium]|nr:NADH-quinone oxidoreductase subunit D [Ardenticatenaceae bacterium]MCB9003779.1 NADH-quinone oxidoreductase subunit D [Ardenticatenaceae bacterium]
MTLEAPVAGVKDHSPEATIALLKERYPEHISDDARDGYEGIIVHPDKIVEISRDLQSELGYNYLASLTGVDLIDDNKLEIVYHTASIKHGGNPLVLKVQVDRDNPVLPSVTPIWPGAEYQEREAFDMYGFQFEGHPDLRRILTWDGFHGYPLRKDWREPFYEEDNKPFGSRWPGGEVFRAEERNLYGKNVQYPAGWMPEGDEIEAETDSYAGITYSRDQSPDIKTEKVTINMGPQHPSTHGVFRMAITLDGETIMGLKPVMGYLHRNHEKIGERNTFIGNIPYTDRLDYISSMSNNHGYVLAVEKLMDATVPERAEWIRILMVELTRIANHLWAIGFLLNDLGALQTPMLYYYIERELILDFFEAASGSRMMCNYMRFGGVAYDLPDDVRGQPVMKFLHDLIYERLPKALNQGDQLITGNEIVRARGMGVGYLSPEDAIAYSAAGPVLRASGVPYDLRKANPYSYYEHLDFDVAVRYNGDIYDRFLIRVDEMQQSLRILQQVLPHLEETEGGAINDGKPQYAIRMPKAGEAYGRVENPKGELGYYVTAKRRDANPARYHVRSPSFINLTALEKMCIGHKVADVVAILGSIDIVLGEVDR